LRAKKAFGQNFLHDPGLCRTIAELVETPPGGTVLEIGPGLGALTTPLLERAGHVVAVERDRDLVPLLQEAFAPAIAEGRLTLLEDDAATVDWLAVLRAAGPAPHRLAGNLPYAITGRLLQIATNVAPHLERAVFMVQREVADRLVASPASKDYGALTVFAQAAFSIERALSIGSGAFWPAPEVESSVVVLRPHARPRALETAAFAEAVKRAFAQRRKTLRNAWKGLYGLPEAELAARAARAGVDLTARGETLSVEQFAAVAEGREPEPQGM
jgi:16S rRNA (adenine1518-N6/adenine1519-N6)-dimethyltransferase